MYISLHPISAPGASVTELTDPIHVKLPNSNIITSTQSTYINYHQPHHLPKSTLLTYILPDLKSPTVLSVHQLFRSECVATFNSQLINISYNQKPICQGNINPTTGLWTIPPNEITPNHQCNYVTSSLPTYTKNN